MGARLPAEQLTLQLSCNPLARRPGRIFSQVRILCGRGRQRMAEQPADDRQPEAQADALAATVVPDAIPEPPWNYRSACAGV